MRILIYNLTVLDSHATKRKFDEDVKDVVRNVASSSTTASPPTKMQKSNEDIEVITLDSSDEDETSSNSDTITSQNGECMCRGCGCWCVLGL